MAQIVGFGVGLCLFHRFRAELNAVYLPATGCYREAVGADAAIAVHHHAWRQARHGLKQERHNPLGLGGVDLEEGVGGNAQIQTTELLQEPAATSDHPGFFAHQ